MIFVAFGNSPCQFTRLANAADKLPLIFNDTVLVQSGHTEFDFKNAKAIPFMTHKEFYDALTACNTVILQGGWGGGSRGLGIRL